MTIKCSCGHGKAMHFHKATPLRSERVGFCRRRDCTCAVWREAKGAR